jgi:hypothetical protein
MKPIAACLSISNHAMSLSPKSFPPNSDQRATDIFPVVPSVNLVVQARSLEGISSLNICFTIQKFRYHQSNNFSAYFRSKTYLDLMIPRFSNNQMEMGNVGLTRELMPWLFQRYHRQCRVSWPTCPKPISGHIDNPTVLLCQIDHELLLLQQVSGH